MYTIRPFQKEFFFQNASSTLKSLISQQVSFLMRENLIWVDFQALDAFSATALSTRLPIEHDNYHIYEGDKFLNHNEICYSEEGVVDYVVAPAMINDQWHEHKNSESLIMCDRWEGVFRFWDYEHAIVPGSTFYVPKNVAHWIKSERGVWFVSIQSRPIKDDQTGEFDYVSTP